MYIDWGRGRVCGVAVSFGVGTLVSELVRKKVAPISSYYYSGVGRCWILGG